MNVRPTRMRNTNGETDASKSENLSSSTPTGDDVEKKSPSSDDSPQANAVESASTTATTEYYEAN